MLYDTSSQADGSLLLRAYMGHLWCLSIQGRCHVWTRAQMADLPSDLESSKKYSDAQRNYETFEHEMITILEGLLKWEDN